MSFLDNLQEMRKTLRPTDTVITTVDGKRYLKKANTRLTDDLIQLEKDLLGFVIDNKPDETPACIVENFLYLGSQDACTDDTLLKYKISYVLSVGVEMPTTISPLIDVKNLYVPCLDLIETNLNDEILDNSFRFIEECRRMKKGRVLIHCNAGVSRSASVTIAYLIKYHKMSYNDAYDHVKMLRPCIQPNDGFRRQLKLLQ